MHDASRYIKQAEHLMTYTYPMLGSPKILKIAMNNVYIGLRHLMKQAAKLETDDFSDLIDASERNFRERGINKKFIDYLKQVNRIMIEQKKSDIEFSRKDKYIFASQSYNLQVLNEKDVKDYILKAKLLLNLVI
jgi:hypothetical protein